LTHAVDRLHEWAEKHHVTLFRALVFAAVVLALLLRALHVTGTPSRSPDERLYTFWAQELAHGGLGAYAGIFDRYLSDPGQWIYPSPTRVFHVVLFAAVMKLTGSTSAQAGAAVSFVLAIGSVGLVAWIGGRFFNRFVGVLAALFLATYVVELEFARRAWGESAGTFASLLSLAAACRLAGAPHRLSSRVQFILAGVLCVLTKETSMLAHGLCAAWLVFDRLASRDVRSAVSLALGGIGSVLGAFGVLWLLAGDAGDVLAGWGHVFGNGLGSNEWGAQNASGPWYQFVALLWVIAPFTASMAAVGALGAALLPASAPAFRGLVPGARSRARLLLLATAVFIGACAFGPNLQYLRIMAPANPAYCLLAALGVRGLLLASDHWGRGRAYPALLLMLPAALGLAWMRDYGLYRDVVVSSGMQDMTARWVLEGARTREARQLGRSQQALVARPPSSTPTPNGTAASGALPANTAVGSHGAPNASTPPNTTTLPGAATLPNPATPSSAATPSRPGAPPGANASQPAAPAEGASRAGQQP
jgi:hypothetical protein